jgi:2-dehydropantolactone reductase
MASLKFSKFQNNILDKDGNQIKIGFGVGSYWRIYKSENKVDFVPDLVEQLKTAIESGFKMIDGAEAYNTYPEIGAALKETGVKREDIWITDKYLSKSYELRGSTGPIDSLNRALGLMDIDYVDMYLLHSPTITKENAGITLEEAWQQCEQLVAAGKAKQIGVSNFRVDDLERIMKICKIKPMCNQIEFHPYLQAQSPGIREYCFQHEIQLEAFSVLTPLTKCGDDPVDNPILAIVDRLSKKYNKTTSQVLLRWCTQLGVLALTTTSSAERIRQSLDIFDFELTDDEMIEIINTKDAKFFRGWGKDFMPYTQEQCNIGL